MARRGIDLARFGAEVYSAGDSLNESISFLKEKLVFFGVRCLHSVTHLYSAAYKLMILLLRR